MYSKDVPFETLLGLTVTKIDGCSDGSEEVRIETVEGRAFRMYHYQDCCETVYLHDVAGDPQDLIGSPLLMAECASNDAGTEEVSESGTWTFYKFATVKGSVTLRWLGSSNGYYSERVDFEELPRETPVPDAPKAADSTS